jgi:Rrf2 family transcriptional regulator, nitric oxide-sensitive transcriptional repressor
MSHASLISEPRVRLTHFTDYSLRVLMYLATRPGTHATIAEIAAAFAISESHLTKVVHHLGRKGLLSNVRGRGGGIELGCSAAHINVGAVVRAAEAGAAIVECFDPRRNRCVITPVCQLRGVLSEAVEALYATLDKYTLDDITQNRHGLQQVLATKPSE